MEKEASTCGCSQHLSSSSASAEISLTGTPIYSGANALADSLGVSPLYRQIDTARWHSAAQVYHSSRAHSPTSSTLNLTQIDGPISGSRTPLVSEDIAAMNRKSLHEIGKEGGNLELEAIAAVHELSNSVSSISVSEILPRTADLIFVNVKTIEDHAYTLELTMKGWRVASTHTDSMNGDYMNVQLHTQYFPNVKAVMDVISPGCKQNFDECLCKRLEQLQTRKTSEVST